VPRKQEPTTPSAPERSSFESEFERLSTIVDRLEQGNVPLAEMLTLYEEAMTLSAKLKSVLTDAELRVEKLAAVHEEMTVTEEIEETNDLPESEDLF
jgi:exodeoxyribonuclease VII small subunit